jgi:hypothetical protein
MVSMNTGNKQFTEPKNPELPERMTAMAEELLLRPGVQVATALDTLRNLVDRATNVAGSSGLGRLLTDHITWVEDAELQLRHLFRSPSVWQELYTDRYWHLRPLADSRDIRSTPLVQNEATWQRDRLKAIFDQLHDARAALELPDNTLAIVLDTNVFMHYEFYDDVDWPKELGTKAVRLVVPQLVIDELDTLSYRANTDSDRAKKVIRSLQQLRGGAAPTTAIVLPKHENVDLLILPDPPGHPRRPNNDDEILARVEYLAAFVGEDRILLVAGDYGMLLRGTARGLSCVQLREGLLLR